MGKYQRLLKDDLHRVPKLCTIIFRCQQFTRMIAFCFYVIHLVYVFKKIVWSVGMSLLNFRVLFLCQCICSM